MADKKNKRNMIPVVLMLVAALITSVLSYFLNFELKKTLIVLIIVLALFYFLGAALRYLLILFEKQNEKAAFDQGEVIEKDVVKTTEEADSEKEA
ncbi:MAG: hypothetical protein Q4B72_07530 [Lachnospiraceae bacterium]|nr:hypothetical protein [Lachnospiraceae bacterium]